MTDQTQSLSQARNKSRILDRFFARNDLAATVEINDSGATPGTGYVAGGMPHTGHGRAEGDTWALVALLAALAMLICGQALRRRAHSEGSY